MRAWDFLTELQLPKNQWELIISTADKHEASEELINLVSAAYANTQHGSFVKSVHDVISSDWLVIDCDDDPDVDAAIFYRGPRGNESWSGNKIQGLGHDGSRVSKDASIKKIQKLLNQPGWWIESSDAMRQVLLKIGAPIVNDEKLLQRIFNDPKLRMVDQHTYTRSIPAGTITETVFGHPTVRGA